MNLFLKVNRFIRKLNYANYLSYIVVIGIVIKLTSKGQYSGRKLGKNGKILIMKFRTMVNNAEQRERAFVNSDSDLGITKVGKFMVLPV